METNRALRMAEPTEIAGNWDVIRGQITCPLRLDSTRIDAANAYALTGAACLAAMLPAPVAGWRPAPDGIEIVGADRRTLVLFADQGDGSGLATLPGGTATLRRSR